MEEIVTVDGRQFKLTVDRPLTAQEKAQVLTEIRKQTGCGTCGQNVIANMSSYGSIYSMAPVCVTTPKGTTDIITLAAAPMVGTGPYKATFLKSPGTSTVTDGSDAATIAAGRLTFTLPAGTTTNPTAKNVPEATAATVPTVSATYALDDVDVAGARARGLDVTASVIFRVDIEDSCPTGVKTCSEICKVFVTCPVPTCNFIVS